MSVHYFSECLRENMAEAKKHHKLPFAFRVFSAVLGWVFIIKQKKHVRLSQIIRVIRIRDYSNYVY